MREFTRSGGPRGVRVAIRACSRCGRRLADAGLDWTDIQFAYGGSASSGAADIIVNELGLTGIPVINVSNGCATGGSSLASTYSAIASGEFDIGLAVGFDKHDRGAFNASPAEYGLPDWYGETGMMLTTQFFALKLQRYMALNGISRRTLGLVAEKAFENGARCEHAWRRSPVDLDTILSAPMINDPLTKYMFCSPAEGGVALILASEKKARELGIAPVRLKAAVMRTRPPGSFEVVRCLARYRTRAISDSDRLKSRVREGRDRPRGRRCRAIAGY